MATTSTKGSGGGAVAKHKAPDTFDLIERADKGDREALTTLNATLTPEEWQHFGDLAQQTERSVMRAMFGEKHDFTQVATGRRLAAIRRDVAGESATALERLLAERISIMWLALQQAEIVFAQAGDSQPWRQAEWNEKRVESCNRRYLAAIRTLAQVRRLLGPTIQVNIAEKQVNVAGG